MVLPLQGEGDCWRQGREPWRRVSVCQAGRWGLGHGVPLAGGSRLMAREPNPEAVDAGERNGGR